MQQQKEKIHVFQIGFESFLKEFQDKVIAGYRLDESVGHAYFFSGFGCDMYLEIPWVKQEEPVEALASGPFTKEQMEAADWDNLREYVKETYNITDRSRKNLIKKVLDLYAEAGLNESTSQEQYAEFVQGIVKE